MLGTLNFTLVKSTGMGSLQFFLEHIQPCQLVYDLPCEVPNSIILIIVRFDLKSLFQLFSFCVALALNVIKMHLNEGTGGGRRVK